MDCYRPAMTRARAPKSRKLSIPTADDLVVWTKRQRARLYGSLHPQANDPVVPTAAAAWAAVRELYGAPTLYELPEEADRTLERELVGLRRELATDVPPAKLNPRHEHLRVGLLRIEAEDDRGSWHRRIRLTAEAVVPLWVGIGGLAFASRVVWSESVNLSSVTCGDARRAFFQKGGGPADPLGRVELWWLYLRRSILAATPEHYDEARKVWRDAGVSPYTIAAAFCREPGEADELVARELKRKSPTYGSIVLLSAVTDPQLALQFARAQPLNYACGAEEHAFALVDNLGKQAAPVLIALLERVSSGGDARKALAAAAALADPDACAAALPGLTGPTKTVLSAALK